MISFIAAIDSKKGLANDEGIPWQGSLPTDIAHFRDQTKHRVVLMGYNTYLEFQSPLSDRRNLVATRSSTKLRDGFEPVNDVEGFLANTKDDIWVIGGAGLFAATIKMADVLDLTMLDSDFECTKFFPEFQDNFKRVIAKPRQTENGVSFRFTIWHRKDSLEVGQ